MNRANGSAFTLPELAVALTILGILAVLVVPRAASFLVQARRGEAKVNLEHIKGLQAVYRIENGQISDGWIVGHSGTGDKCAKDKDELLNPLGFSPKGCNELRYSYYVDGADYYAYGPSDGENKWIYPDCQGGSAIAECGATSGDKLRLTPDTASTSKLIEVCRDIIKYCPGGTTGSGNTFPTAPSDPRKSCKKHPSSVTSTTCPSGKEHKDNLHKVFLTATAGNSEYRRECCKDSSTTKVDSPTTGTPIIPPTVTETKEPPEHDPTPPKTCVSYAIEKSLNTTTRCSPKVYDEEADGAEVDPENIATWMSVCCKSAETCTSYASANGFGKDNKCAEDSRIFNPSKSGAKVYPENNQRWKAVCCKTGATCNSYATNKGFGTLAAKNTRCGTTKNFDPNKGGTNVYPETNQRWKAVCCKSRSCANAQCNINRKLITPLPNPINADNASCCECQAESNLNRPCQNWQTYDRDNTHDCCHCPGTPRQITNNDGTKTTVCCTTGSVDSCTNGSWSYTGPITGATCACQAYSCANPPPNAGSDPKCLDQQQRNFTTVPNLSSIPLGPRDDISVFQSKCCCPDYNPENGICDVCVAPKSAGNFPECKCPDSKPDGYTCPDGGIWDSDSDNCCRSVPAKCVDVPSGQRPTCPANANWAEDDTVGSTAAECCFCDNGDLTSVDCPCDKMKEPDKTNLQTVCTGEWKGTNTDYTSCCEIDCSTSQTKTCTGDDAHETWDDDRDTYPNCCECPSGNEQTKTDGDKVCCSSAIPTTCESPDTWSITGPITAATCVCNPPQSAKTCNSYAADRGWTDKDAQCSPKIFNIFKGTTTVSPETDEQWEANCCSEIQTSCDSPKTLSPEGICICPETRPPDYQCPATQPDWDKTEHGGNCCKDLGGTILPPEPKTCGGFVTQEQINTGVDDDDETISGNSICGVGYRYKEDDTIELSPFTKAQFKDTCCEAQPSSTTTCSEARTSKASEVAQCSGTRRGTWKTGADGDDAYVEGFFAGKCCVCPDGEIEQETTSTGTRIDCTCANGNPQTCSDSAKRWFPSIEEKPSATNCCHYPCPASSQTPIGGVLVDKRLDRNWYRTSSARVSHCYCPKSSRHYDSTSETCKTSCLDWANSGSRPPSRTAEQHRNLNCGAGKNYRTDVDTKLLSASDNQIDECCINERTSTPPCKDVTPLVCPTPTVQKWDTDSSSTRKGNTANDCCIAKTCSEWRGEASSESMCGTNFVFNNVNDQIPEDNLDSPTTFCCSQKCVDMPSTAGSERKACEDNTECTWNTTNSLMPNCTSCQMPKAWTWDGVTGSCDCSTNSACVSDNYCSLDDDCDPQCSGVGSQARTWSGSQCVCNNASINCDSYHQGDDDGIRFNSATCSCACISGFNNEGTNSSPFCCPNGQIKHPSENRCCVVDPNDSTKCHQGSPLDPLVHCYLNGLGFQAILDEMISSSDCPNNVGGIDLTSLNLGISATSCGDIDAHTHVWDAYKNARDASDRSCYRDIGRFGSNFDKNGTSSLIDAIRADNSSQCGGLGTENTGHQDKPSCRSQRP